MTTERRCPRRDLVCLPLGSWRWYLLLRELAEELDGGRAIDLMQRLLRLVREWYGLGFRKPLLIACVNKLLLCMNTDGACQCRQSIARNSQRSRAQHRARSFVG